MERLTGSTRSFISTRNLCLSLQCCMAPLSTALSLLKQMYSSHVDKFKKRDAWWTWRFHLLTDLFSCFSSHLVTSSKSRGWFLKHSQLQVLPRALTLQELLIGLSIFTKSNDNQSSGTFSGEVCLSMTCGTRKDSEHEGALGKLVSQPS